jgi:hypothetical protein
VKQSKKLISLIALILFVALAPIAHAASLHVGEVGKVIQYFPNPQPPVQPAASTISLSGLVVVMDIKQPGGTVISRTMTVSSDGTNATYSIVAGDLPTAGNYIFQWFASSGSVLVLKSDQIAINVGPSF